MDQVVDPSQPTADEQRAAQQVRGDTAGAYDPLNSISTASVEVVLDIRDLRRQRLVPDELGQSSGRSFKLVIVAHQRSIAPSTTYAERRSSSAVDRQQPQNRRHIAVLGRASLATRFRAAARSSLPPRGSNTVQLGRCS